ncbi:MAG: alpha-L-arabinofuranosidase C-terminal domain-containing protein [Armatimonadota bacterium]
MGNTLFKCFGWALVVMVPMVVGNCAHAVSGGEALRASITIDARMVVGKVNPGVLGGNMIGYQKGAYGGTGSEYTDRSCGVWDPEHHRAVPEMVALARNIGMSFARYLGGCGVHLFDWKKAVGPLSARPDQKFGLPEFMQLCGEIGAVPLITVADYHGTAQDAADLVEYLNGPNDGKHPWAALRVSDGHPAPWKAVWHEYGNESEHGDHGSQRMSAQQYAHNYLNYRHAMRTVDPHIKLGAVVATGFPNLNDWARPVLTIAGAGMDFAIHHSYKFNYSGENGVPDAQTIFAMALAGADQIQDYYDEMNALIRKVTGLKDIPIAVTEYNGAFVQEKPVPYRHTLGNALVNADQIRVFMQPKNNIIMANFWEFANEYWGTVKGFTYRHEPLVKRPQYYPLDLYHNHFGRELLGAKVDCGTYNVSSGYGIASAKGKGSKHEVILGTVNMPRTWSLLDPPAGVTHRLDGNRVVVDFDTQKDIDYYSAMKIAPAKPGLGYRLTGMVKTEGLTSISGASCQIGDGRGWDATRSAVLTPNITGTHDWTSLTTDYIALDDTKSIMVMARRQMPGGAIKGRAIYGDTKVTEFIPKHYPAVPILSVNASRTLNGGKGKLYVMLVNKDQQHPLSVRVSTPGFAPASASAWILSGPTVDATNEQNPQNVQVIRKNLGAVNGPFTFSIPAHSLTALEIEGKMR